MRVRTTVVLWPCAVLAMVSFGCVETDGERPDEKISIVPADPGSGPYNCNQDDDYELALLDDFEFGSASGTWFANNDICEDCQAMAEERNALMEAQADMADAGVDNSTEIDGLSERLLICRDICTSSQFPTIFDKPLPAESIPGGGRCGSSYAMHLTTQKLIDWGANLGTALVPPFNAVPGAGDESPDGELEPRWEGISFWARRAPHSNSTVRVEIADKHTDEKYVGPDGEPFCNPDFTEDSLFEGCDRFGGYALFGPDWKFFTLPFDELRQAGWGRRAPYMDIEALRSLTFLFAAGTWDIWIDDVAFYRRRAN